MRGGDGRGIDPERGSAAVELVAALPFLLLALALAAQLALVGHSLWSAGLAARAGARAALVGDDAAAAAERALPGLLRRGAAVDEGSGVEVEVAVPRLLPALPEVRVAESTELDGG